MIKWIKTGKEITGEGSIVRYRGEGTDLIIESRKQHIPHANRSGTWDHTTYFILCKGVEVKELYRLQDAKEYAEGYTDGEGLED